MEISEFTFKLILIFLPGLIAFYIIDALTPHKEAKLHKIVLFSLIYGFVCYFTYYLVTKLVFFLDLPFFFLESLTNSSTPLNFEEITWVTILSFPIAFIITALHKYRVLYRIAYKLKVSEFLGNLGVWGYTLDNYGGWVVIRDLENNLTYKGWLEAYSDITDDDEEFLLIEVEVFNSSSGEKQYCLPVLYFARDKRKLNVEFILGNSYNTDNEEIEETK
ncbi:MAG: hypothetical protein IH874_02960 [Candidatus Dadabacteria bacterium]|nr:hypothetical protein [Candidatus Dadabacteria bacterium]